VDDDANLLIARPDQAETLSNHAEPAVRLGDRQRRIVEPRERRDEPFVDPRPAGRQDPSWPSGDEHGLSLTTALQRERNVFEPKYPCNSLLLEVASVGSVGQDPESESEPRSEPQPRSKSRQARDWDDLATVDPLWAVLSVDDKRNRRWELEAFLSTGEAEVEHMLATAAKLNRPARRERALDFGCGVGRLTRALASHLAEVVGIDVSERMLEHARRLNADTPNLTFASSDEPPAGPFDLVVANLVLQHLPSKARARDNIRRLIEAARQEGLVVFQLPTRLPLAQRFQPRRRVYSALRTCFGPARLHGAGLHPVRILALGEADVRATVESAGATVAHTESAAAAGLRYYVHHRSP
jgi:SAM-dependent methyltransferase